MALVQFSQEALEVALVFGRSFMISLLELGVTDECLAVFAPVLWLYYCQHGLSHVWKWLRTVDFQYSDIFQSEGDFHLAFFQGSECV